jgi:uncharacterized membrane protein
MPHVCALRVCLGILVPMTFLAFVAVFVLIWVLFQRTSKQDARLSHMEQYLKDATAYFSRIPDMLQKHATESGVRKGASLEEPVPTVSTRSSDTQDNSILTATQNERDWSAAFISWFKEDWMMKIGGLLVVLGVGFFVTSFAVGIFGKYGIIAIGIVLSLGVLVAGRHRIAASVSQGSVLMAIGAAAFVLTVYAAQHFYDMFPPLLALGAMVVVSSVLGVTAVSVRRRALAYATIILLAFVPFLAQAPVVAAESILHYLLVLFVGAVVVTMLTKWRDVLLASLVVFSVYSVMLFDEFRAHELETALLWAYGFIALYTLLSLWGVRQNRILLGADTAIGFLSGAMLLWWTLDVLPAHMESVVLTAWALVFGVAAYIMVRRGAPIAVFYVYAGVASVLLSVALALELDGPALTIAALGEAMVVLVVGYAASRNHAHLPVLALPLLVPAALSLEHVYDFSVSTTVWNQHAGVLLLIIVAVFATARYFFLRSTRSADVARQRVEQGLAVVLAWVAGLYSIAWVWIALHVSASSYHVGTLLALLLYSAVAVWLLVTHHTTRERWRRHASTLLIVLVVGRLLLVEVWNNGMNPLVQVLVFVGVGVLLVAGSWLERNVLSKLDDPAKK